MNGIENLSVVSGGGGNGGAGNVVSTGGLVVDPMHLSSICSDVFANMNSNVPSSGVDAATIAALSSAMDVAVANSANVQQQQHQHQQQQQAHSPDILTLRLLMSGKEVGSIIGKKGSNVKRYREESGARINISDGSSPERIVTVIGSPNQIHLAFSLMAQKFEEDLVQSLMKEDNQNMSNPLVTLRLLVPGPLCGSIIGKGGQKIKDIREATGASIQVASEVLPQSTERIVTLGGTAKAIGLCVRVICDLVQECPNKGPVIPYKPRPTLGTTNMYLHSPLGPLLPGASLALSSELAKSFAPSPSTSSLAPQSVLSQPNAQQPTGMPAAFLSLPLGAGGAPVTAAPNPLAASIFPGLQGLAIPQANFAAFPYGLFANAAAAAAQAQAQTHHTQEMVIPNELIGCVIGRGGNKINEIRQASGAQIKISNVESGGKDRKITISGTADQVQMARLFIQQSIEAHTQMLALNLLAAAAGHVGHIGSAPSSDSISPTARDSLGQPTSTTPSSGPTSTNTMYHAFLRPDLAPLSHSHHPSHVHHPSTQTMGNPHMYLSTTPPISAAASLWNFGTNPPTPAATMFPQGIGHFFPSSNVVVSAANMINAAAAAAAIGAPNQTMAFTMATMNGSSNTPACAGAPVVGGIVGGGGVAGQSPLISKMKTNLATAVPKYSPY